MPLTIAEEQVPDPQQRIEGQVTCEETHEPVGSKHEGLHAMMLQMFVCSWTHPLQDPVQNDCIKQDSLLFKKNHCQPFKSIELSFIGVDEEGFFCMMLHISDAGLMSTASLWSPQYQQGQFMAFHIYYAVDLKSDFLTRRGL